ncbi:MAG: response regulator [Acidobacteriia bacterium]|nr:response regulator [Terriglobia bacterium]
MTILIADDDRVLVQVISVRLKKAGYRVVIVYDAMQAIVTALRNPPDAILLDVNMPGGTGRQVLRQLKNSPKTSQVPIIVITGSNEPDVVESVKALGADEFMSKPPNFERLQAILKARLCTERV